MRAALAGAVAVLAAVPAAGAGATCATPADISAGRRAAAWLASRDAAAMPPGQLADTIVALRAAGRPASALASRTTALRRRGPAYAATAGASAKVALAALAVRADPARFGGVDYLARIRRAYADGRYGATAYDQAFSMMALAGAGRPVPAAAVRALRGTRGTGGWGFDLRAASRDQVDATAVVLEALAAAGVSPRTAWVASARAWMLSQRGRDGGVASAGGGRPADGNTTAMAWRALCASGAPVPARLRSALRSLQAADGRIRFTTASEGSPLMATTDAVVALTGRTLPPR
ncbi:MAG: hypothetical protein IT200_02450 [Thermoleophilia bacterium]|nr:hypothetical protein [Thermoleophilia bacterium]